MPNHVHLVVEMVAEDSMSNGMQWLGSTYAKYFNGRHCRVGHVYQGRFYSHFVDREAYLFEVTRYVHLNPFRAKLVRHPVEYVWSSYRMYLGLDHDPRDLVEPDRILRLFGSGPAEQVDRYRRFVEGLAEHEAERERWIRRLERRSLIPPRRWSTPMPAQIGSGTFSPLKSA